ncbi:MAG TPA: tRNA uridine-5-carboxymethylaminomethyl(34) synthesis enzyme MnmG [Sphaerochaeta sp.]|nr:tRNA uridine-5-carboxymethylaminomethyl(34) synthesis enzyme MnmG [Sphaerochaeta sp.]
MEYDAIVVGGGHAGIEGSLALARMGFSTLLITQSLDTIGMLSCNPAIGGLSKGNIVREVDALGGAMGDFIDETMIQYRILNRRRGPAVQAPRAQADKFSYNRLAKETVENQANLSLFMDTVVDIRLSATGDTYEAVITERGHTISSKVLVLTTGTFMEAKVFIGTYQASSGRLGEPAVIGLGTALEQKGFSIGRMMTGTSARVRSSSLDYTQMEEQPGEEEMQPFSFSRSAIQRPSMSCHITWTNERTHQIIAKNMHLSPLYGGKVSGAGPRYCPSIEDKVVRFPDRTRHQVFVEPEGIGSEEVYLNGVISSLAEEVQRAFIHSIAGLEGAEIMRPGYAVEYDYIDPRTLYPSLESKVIANLFIAGQTNGTSGYEEAACQGLIAGINAAQKLRGEAPLILGRNEAYIGVLIDDLVTMGTKEPYRMFTSRAEYRLNLRHDSADQRLTQRGWELGLQSDAALERLKEKLEDIDAVKELLRQRSYQRKQAIEALKMPEVTIETLKEEIEELDSYSNQILDQVELDVKYAGYVDRQSRQIARFEKMEALAIAADFNYDVVPGLSNEGREKLKEIRPFSVGQASRINGVRNSDIAILMVHIQRGGA